MNEQKVWLRVMNEQLAQFDSKLQVEDFSNMLVDTDDMP